MKFKLTLLVLITCLPFLLFSQDPPYSIKRSSGTITIDGVLDDAGWDGAEVVSDFYMYNPMDSIPATILTEVRLTYDDQFIYFGAKMYNKNIERQYVSPSLRRDYRGRGVDVITFMIDPFQDKTNAFMFGVNPYGVQREGLISNGGNQIGGFDMSWDNKWYSEAVQYEGYWIAEMAIPFKTLRFKGGAEKWNINFYRQDSDATERTSWSPIPRTYELYSLAFNRELLWDKPLGKSGPNVSIIPYAAGGLSSDFEEVPQTGVKKSIAFGGDAKIAVSSALNLDLTVNPDFSQVEVDEQVTNLDRFELSFPEKRQFFLENSDLFSSFGHPLLARPFFSRKIGIAIDSSTNQNIQNKIYYGARLSGKLDNNWRVGVLNLQAAKDSTVGLPSLNYTVAAVQRKLFTRSNIGAIFINRQALVDSTGDGSFRPETFNRIAGIDYNLASANNHWVGKFFYHRSFDEKNDPGQYAHATYLLYRSRTWQFDWSHVIIGQQYEAPVGYLPRKGIYRINPLIGYNILADNQAIIKHEFQIESEVFWNSERRIDQLTALKYNADFLNTGRLETSINRDFIYLQKDFDPTRTEGAVKLPANTFYTYTYTKFNYKSDYRKLVGYGLLGSLGQFYNGTRVNLNTEVNIRFVPHAALLFKVDYNRIRLPQPYNSIDLFLVGPRFDLTLTRKLFFTTFIQYNSQINNVNINSRLQWRFKPVSDLFIVYTDNYGTEDPFNPANRFLIWQKNRALVVKLTYWLNV